MPLSNHYSRLEFVFVGYKRQDDWYVGSVKLVEEYGGEGGEVILPDILPYFFIEVSLRKFVKSLFYKN